MHYRATAIESLRRLSRNESAYAFGTALQSNEHGGSLSGQLAAFGMQERDLMDRLDPVGPVIPALHGYSPSAELQPSCASRVMVDIRVTDPAGRPISGADVTYLNGAVDSGDIQRTDRRGRAILTIQPRSDTGADRLIVEASGCWGLQLDRPALHPVTSSMSLCNTVVLKPMSLPAIDSPCWGQEAMRLDAAPQCSELGSAPVRVVVVSCHPIAGPGSGFWADPFVFVPEAEARRGWARSIPEPPQTAMTETFSQALATVVATAAPGVLVDRLFLPRAARVSDLVLALDHCLRTKVDIVCLCLSAPCINDALLHTLRLARASGLVIVAPAGDEAGPVNPIAGSDPVLGVAALGNASAVPKTSPHFRLMASHATRGYAPMVGAAKGAGINLIAPGIAVLPRQDAMSGTALAAAYATGFLARMLQASPGILGMPRSAIRATALEAMLMQSCVDCGVGGPSVQGAGLPVWGSKGRRVLCSRAEQDLARDAQLALDRMGAPRFLSARTDQRLPDHI